MAAMQNRRTQPTQTSLFDEAPATDATATGAAATDGDTPPLPVPAFLPGNTREASDAADTTVHAEPADAAETAALPSSMRPAGGKPPLWARLMGRLIDPWLKLDIAPEQPQAERIGQRPRHVGPGTPPAPAA